MMEIQYSNNFLTKHVKMPTKQHLKRELRQTKQAKFRYV